jgi:hypothetical protein
MNQQIQTMILLVRSGEKVLHTSGAYYCRIGGREFPSKFLPAVREELFEQRKRKRAAREAGLTK